jgi:hypothetical protein
MLHLILRSYVSDPLTWPGCTKGRRADYSLLGHLGQLIEELPETRDPKGRRSIESSPRSATPDGAHR